jgi:hypothetical protein
MPFIDPEKSFFPTAAGPFVPHCIESAEQAVIIKFEINSQAFIFSMRQLQIVIVCNSTHSLSKMRPFDNKIMHPEDFPQYRAKWMAKVYNRL